MPPLIFGTKQQLRFNTENDFYESLGFLSKNDNTTSIHWENNENQGAWGSEGRIHCYKNIANFPNYFSTAFTAGTGNILHRINCNEYIDHIVRNHGFVLGHIQPNPPVNIPPAFMPDYNRGLSL